MKYFRYCPSIISRWAEINALNVVRARANETSALSTLILTCIPGVYFTLVLEGLYWQVGEFRL